MGYTTAGAGDPGPQGYQGYQGDQGPQGDTVQGPQGFQGNQGNQGFQGADGNGNQHDILDANHLDTSLVSPPADLDVLTWNDSIQKWEPSALWAGHVTAASDRHAAPDISYDNTVSGLIATNVKDAIDEVDAAHDNFGVLLTPGADEQTWAAAPNTFSGWQADSNALKVWPGLTDYTGDLVRIEGIGKNYAGRMLVWETNTQGEQGEIDAAGNLILGAGVQFTAYGGVQGALIGDDYLDFVGVYDAGYQVATQDYVQTYIGTISRGGSILNPSDGQTIMVWRCPGNYTVTNVRTHFKGGTSIACNARRNQTSNHLASDYTNSTADVWGDAGAVQNTAYVAGDDLEIMVVTVTGAVTEVSVQVDFVPTYV